MKESTTKHTPETSVIYKSNDDIIVLDPFENRDYTTEVA